MTPIPENPPETITVTLHRTDAYVIALGPLDYAIKSTAGEVPKGGSVTRLRQTFMQALASHGIDNDLSAGRDRQVKGAGSEAVADIGERPGAPHSAAEIATGLPAERSSDGSEGQAQQAASEDETHVDLVAHNPLSSGSGKLLRRTQPDDPEIGAQVRSGWATYVYMSEPHTMADCPFEDAP